MLGHPQFRTNINKKMIQKDYTKWKKYDKIKKY